MVFNTYIFWAFFLTVLTLYHLSSRRHRVQNLLLLVGSYVFYQHLTWKLLVLLAACTLASYAAGLGIGRSEKSSSRKRWVAFACVVNLGVLGFFKYYNFFAGEAAALLSKMRFNVTPESVSLRLFITMGVSFFVFKAISYVVDVYRGQLQATRRLDDFALFVAFFPSLLAGPIDRGKGLLPQIQQPRKRRGDDFSVGLYLILFGLFKKMVIADNMAAIATPIFNTDPVNLSGHEVLLGIYAYTLQIYGDFAGYSDIARGVARWLGFDLMVNFRMPYLATTPSDFWNRWHISLSSWLKDYLYIPLGGNRGGEAKTYRNLSATMVLGGLWHGANWTFIFWGAWHGLILCIYRVLGFRNDVTRSKERGARASWWARAIGMFVMFHLVAFGWLMFNAHSMTQVGQLLSRLVSALHWSPLATWITAQVVFFGVPMLLYEFWLHRKNDDILALTKVHWIPRAMWYAYMALMLLYFWPESSHGFIYFNF